MSVIFDCFWWWRAEFGGKSFPYDRENGDRADQQRMNDYAEPPLIPPQPNSADQQQGPDPENTFVGTPNFHLTAEELGVFPDWEWAAAFRLPESMDIDSLAMPEMPC
jgi:transcriptional regulatory protein LEU3